MMPAMVVRRGSDVTTNGESEVDEEYFCNFIVLGFIGIYTYTCDIMTQNQTHTLYQSQFPSFDTILQLYKISMEGNSVKCTWLSLDKGCMYSYNLCKSIVVSK